LPQVGYRIDIRLSGRPGEISRPYVEQFRIGQTGRHRPFIEWIGPDRHRAGNSGRFDESGRARAVGDVQEA
jgi:hypothetical protein